MHTSTIIMLLWQVFFSGLICASTLHRPLVRSVFRSVKRLLVVAYFGECGDSRTSKRARESQ